MREKTATVGTPRLRGLDPELLLGVLGGDGRESLPRIPGWKILGVAGEGGSGIVWRAERVSDGVAAAIKIAPPGEPETVERIEREAGFLRELRHPHIVELLETGALEEGEQAGGLYLAMELIDGPALVNEIPERGLPPEKAFRWFREIVSAVAHAHDAGVLHRDLKPANVLVDPDGRVKVADFGLARPVHRRVHLLSLTRAGLVAGTAEYLPPEAYRGDYRPGPAADLFALGVMLHEMLTGTPPRGAWLPASTREGVDVRIDGIIRRAMDPDPEQRWPDPQAMVAALDEVLASPPRFAGAPLVTFPLRVADCLWTLLGLFLFMAGTSSLLALDKAWVRLPFDLVGDHGRLIGGFHALFVLTLLGIPLGAWQIARLWRFRHIPLREALPSPFGLRLGHSRTAAVLVFLGQLVCLLIPVVQMLALFRESSLTWLQASDPPWTYGLAVTANETLSLVSPWKFPESGAHYQLWESDGPPGHALSRKLEQISFVPFFAPALMLGGGLLAAGALLAAVLTACRLWWCRRQCCRSVLAVGSLAAMVLLLATIHAHEARIAREDRLSQRDDATVEAHMTRHLVPFAESLLGAGGDGPAFGADGARLAYYAESVNYRDFGMVSREEIPRLSAVDRSPAREFLIKVLDVFPKREGPGEWFELRVKALEFYDGLSDGGGSEVALVELEFAGYVTACGHTRIQSEKLTRKRLWLAGERMITPQEAAAWARALQDAALAAARDPQASSADLAGLFQAVSVEPDTGKSAGQWYQRGGDHAGSVIGMLMDGVLTLQPDAATFAESLPGGRSRIAIPVQAGIPRVLHADLVHVAGNWRCVKLAF